MSVISARRFLPLKPALSLVVLLALTACATAPKIPPKERIKTEGYVVAKAISNGKFILHHPLGTSSIGIESVDGGEHYKLWRAPHGAYVGWVPEGDYKIADLSTRSRAGIAAHLYGAKPMLTPFHVTTGRAVDLGEIVVQPIGESEVILIPMKSSLDVSAVVSKWQPSVAKALLSRPIEHERLSPVFPLKPIDIGYSSGLGLIADLLVDLGQKGVAGDRQLRWDTARDADDLLQLAKRSTIRLFSSFFTKDGTGLFGSTLGQILIRSPNGQWHNLETGYVDAVVGVAKSGDTIVAAFRSGRISFTEDNGATWQPVALKHHVHGSIKLLGSVTPGQYLLVTQTFNDAGPGLLANVYQLSDIKDPILESLGKVHFDSRSVSRARPAQTNALIALNRGHLFIAEDSEHLAIYDIRNDKWTHTETPDDFRAIRASRNNGAVTLHGTHGLFGTDYVSVDDGATWTDANAPSYTRFLQYSNKNEGYGYENGFGDGYLIFTSDGGKHWRHGADMEHNCISLILDDVTKQLLCSLPGGKILSTSDGKHWRIERKNY